VKSQLTVADELGKAISIPFNAKMVAIIFASGKSHNYGQVENLEILYGAQKKLEEAGYDLAVFFSDDDLDKERHLIETVSKGPYKGMILYPVNSTDQYEALLQLKKNDFPFVIIDRPHSQLQTNLVVSDNFDGAYQAVTYLIENGHTDILFLSIDLYYAKSVTQRYEGYCAALKENGIPYRPEYVISNYSKKTINQTLNSLLLTDSSQSSPISAIFAMNDEIAIETMLCLGNRVPHQVSLIGFDDSPTLKHYNVPISTVQQSRIRMGEEAAQIMIDRFNHNATALRQIVLATKLMIRESTKSIQRVIT
jgi:DNA-binding LacI/PurR family transcriptional regulator